jgi:hypothetical protein
VGDLFERELEAHAQIAALDHALAARTPTTELAAKPAPEGIAEDVPNCEKMSSIDMPSAKAAAALWAEAAGRGMAEAIVLRLLLRIAEDLVGDAASLNFSPRPCRRGSCPGGT